MESTQEQQGPHQGRGDGDGNLGASIPGLFLEPPLHVPSWALGRPSGTLVGVPRGRHRTGPPFRSAAPQPRSGQSTEAGLTTRTSLPLSPRGAQWRHLSGLGSLASCHASCLPRGLPLPRPAFLAKCDCPAFFPGFGEAPGKPSLLLPLCVSVPRTLLGTAPPGAFPAPAAPPCPGDSLVSPLESARHPLVHCGSWGGAGGGRGGLLKLQI